jgi:hypothetical protein
MVTVMPSVFRPERKISVVLANAPPHSGCDGKTDRKRTTRDHVLLLNCWLRGPGVMMLAPDT